MTDTTTTAAEPSFYSLEGHEVLRDPATLLPSDATRFTALLARARTGGDDADTASPEFLDAFTDLVELLERRYVADKDAYAALYRRKGYSHMISLVTAFLGEAVAS